MWTTCSNNFYTVFFVYKNINGSTDEIIIEQFFFVFYREKNVHCPSVLAQHLNQLYEKLRSLK